VWKSTFYVGVSLSLKIPSHYIGYACKASATAAASVSGHLTVYTAEDAVKLVSIFLIVAAPKLTL
jgi:hypothetical protein